MNVVITFSNFQIYEAQYSYHSVVAFLQTEVSALQSLFGGLKLE